LQFANQIEKPKKKPLNTNKKLQTTLKILV